MQKTYIHMKVEVNVETPIIARFWWTNSRGAEQWVPIKYERLSDFFYGRDKLGHTIQACREEVTMSEAKSENPMYEPWTTATRPKPN